MRNCPKCQLVYQDASRICRACGAILEDIADEIISEPPAIVEADDRPAAVDDVFGDPLSPTDLADALALQPPPPRAEDWVCTACGETVPAAFDVCWNCEAAGVKPAPASSDSAPRVANEPVAPVPPQLATRRCVACRSPKLLTDVTILDQGQSYSGALTVVVPGNPEALIFKDRLYAQLFADICGECGHVQLRIDNPAELYEHYQQSRS